MMFTQVVLFASVVVMGSTYAVGYGTGGGSYGSGPSSARAGFPPFPSYGGGAGRGQGQNEAPKPYNFDYTADDGKGNVHYRSEQGDQNGRVKGYYAYRDAQGLYRVVEYTADENGFRPNIITNEPGVGGKESPADVVMNVEQRLLQHTRINGVAGGIDGGFARGRPPVIPHKPYSQWM